MDELMMNMFSVIADHVRSRQDLFDEEGKIMQKLVNVGYDLHQADAALTLMQTLAQKQDENFFGQDQTAPASGMRTMSSEERRRFTSDAFVFALKLTRLGVLSEKQREEILERAMGLYRGRITLGHIKSLVAFILFSGSCEREKAASSKQLHVKDTVWN